MTKFTGCTRCQARCAAGRGLCGAPVIYGKRVCKVHGGLSSGPKTPKGRAVSAGRFFLHGRETRLARSRRSDSLRRLLQIEDIFSLYGILVGSRTRGPKPKDYRPIRTFEEAALWLQEEVDNPRAPAPCGDGDKYAPKS